MADLKEHPLTGEDFERFKVAYPAFAQHVRNFETAHNCKVVGAILGTDWGRDRKFILANGEEHLYHWRAYA